MRVGWEEAVPAAAVKLGLLLPLSVPPRPEEGVGALLEGTEVGDRVPREAEAVALPLGTALVARGDEVEHREGRKVNEPVPEGVMVLCKEAVPAATVPLTLLLPL